MHYREQVSQFKLEQSDRLDLTTQKIVDAIVAQQDIFHAVHDTQITLIRALHSFQQQYISKLPHAAQAAFNSSDNQHNPLCLQNTRIDVRNQIRAWADGDNERCIFWLNGMAGTGSPPSSAPSPANAITRNVLGQISSSPEAQRIEVTIESSLPPLLCSRRAYHLCLKRIHVHHR